jgi:hypothetical protein
MTADSSDGIEEELTRAVGIVMLAAGRAAEQLARMKQAADRERQARATGNAEQAEKELAAHTEAARAYFQVVTRPEYLTAATDDQIREAARQAQAWRERLPEAQRAADAAAVELGARTPAPDGRAEQAAALAAEAEVADHRAAAGDQQPADGTYVNPPGWDQVGKYYGHHDGSQQDDQQQPAQQAAATAATAQTRPAREAPAAGQNASRRRVGRAVQHPASRTPQPEVGR